MKILCDAPTRQLITKYGCILPGVNGEKNSTVRIDFRNIKDNSIRLNIESQLISLSKIIIKDQTTISITSSKKTNARQNSIQTITVQNENHAMEFVYNTSEDIYMAYIADQHVININRSTTTAVTADINSSYTDILSSAAPETPVIEEYNVKTESYGELVVSLLDIGDVRHLQNFKLCIFANSSTPNIRANITTKNLISHAFKTTNCRLSNKNIVFEYRKAKGDCIVQTSDSKLIVTGGSAMTVISCVDLHKEDIRQVTATLMDYCI